MDELTVGFTFPRGTNITVKDFLEYTNIRPDDFITFLPEGEDVVIVRHRKTETIRVGSISKYYNVKISPEKDRIDDVLKYYKPEFEDFGPLK